MPRGNFGENLRAALERAGLTQAELAIKAGCTQPDISRYLTAGRIPSGDKLVEIALALKTTAEQLIVTRLEEEPERAVAYNILEPMEAGMLTGGLWVTRPPKRRNREKRLKKLAAQAEAALKALREELERG